MWGCNHQQGSVRLRVVWWQFPFLSDQRLTPDWNKIMLTSKTSERGEGVPWLPWSVSDNKWSSNYRSLQEQKCKQFLSLSWWTFIKYSKRAGWGCRNPIKTVKFTELLQKDCRKKNKGQWKEFFPNRSAWKPPVGSWLPAANFHQFSFHGKIMSFVV